MVQGVTPPAPLPVVLHVVGFALFTILGAFQFAPGFRRMEPHWHRAAGCVLVASGLVAAIAGLWMSFFAPLPESDGPLLAFFRLVVGVTMVAAITLGVAALHRRDIRAHRAWMMRAYALAQGTGTQVFVMLPWLLVFGDMTPLQKALLMGFAWLVTAAVAEWIVWGRPMPWRVAPQQGRASDAAA